MRVLKQWRYDQRSFKLRDGIVWMWIELLIINFRTYRWCFPFYNLLDIHNSFHMLQYDIHVKMPGCQSAAVAISEVNGNNKQKTLICHHVSKGCSRTQSRQMQSMCVSSKSGWIFHNITSSDRACIKACLTKTLVIYKALQNISEKNKQSTVNHLRRMLFHSHIYGRTRPSTLHGLAMKHSSYHRLPESFRYPYKLIGWHRRS